MSALSPEQAQALLDKATVQESASKYEQPPQVGPLRWVDREHRCASRGCGSSTFCKVQGVPKCMKHALEALNGMLVQKGVAA